MYRGLILGAALAFAPLAAQAQQLTETERADVSAIVQEVLAASEVPSASIAIVRGGEIAYAQAYGLADVAANIPATTETVYGIGSTSKQFTAAAILMLAAEGRVDIDQPIAWFDPTLTRANDITLRHLLTHTSGYPDYWPQDYTFPAMARPIERSALLDQWARVPLDFEPGAEFRYANTGYVIAGMMIERLSRRPLRSVLQRRIFTPLHMSGVTEINTSRPLNSVGHSRWGLGPIIPSMREGSGWLTGAGQLAMRPTDLALWNISLMRGGLLSAEQIAALTTPSSLTPASPNYALGMISTTDHGKRIWSHPGGVTGYTSGNTIYPDEDLAITVLTNGDYGGGAATILPRLAFRLREQPAEIARVRDQLTAFQAGHIDRSLYTANANGFYSDAGVAAVAQSMAPLGPVRGIVLLGSEMRGGFTDELYRIAFARRSGTAAVRVDPASGLIEEFNIYFGPP
ncbi:MAG: serine hydrolase domain-containing protein [Hyphomonadaceae bacterium]